jgi:hypothetical protein
VPRDPKAFTLGAQQQPAFMRKEDDEAAKIVVICEGNSVSKSVLAAWPEVPTGMQQLSGDHNFERRILLWVNTF